MCATSLADPFSIRHRWLSATFFQVFNINRVINSILRTAGKSNCFSLLMMTCSVIDCD